MVTRQLGAHSEMRFFLRPLRVVLAARLASHKLLRWFAPVFMVGAVLISLTLIDRWLHRVFVHLDHRRSRGHRPGDGPVLT